MAVGIKKKLKKVKKNFVFVNTVIYIYQVTFGRCRSVGWFWLAGRGVVGLFLGRFLI
jgi:hypothetical protein